MDILGHLFASDLNGRISAPYCGQQARLSVTLALNGQDYTEDTRSSELTVVVADMSLKRSVPASAAVGK